jgi:hypothetical protein
MEVCGQFHTPNAISPAKKPPIPRGSETGWAPEPIWTRTPWQWRTEKGGWGGWNLPPKFKRFDKAEPNSHFRGIYIHNNVIRIRVSFICKSSGTPDKGATAPRSPFSLPSVLNWICWTPPPRKKSWVRHCVLVNIKSLVPAGNRTMIPRPSSQLPSHYRNYVCGNEYRISFHFTTISIKLSNHK